MKTWILIFGWSLLSADAQDLATRINQKIKAYKVPREQMGLIVSNLETPANKVEFSLNAREDFIPASTTKIITAVAVLRRLTPSHRFQTTLWTDAEVKEGKLQGDLILKGGGDSGFVSETMWFLVNEFTRNGIREIEGDIIVDDTDFDDVRTDGSRDPVRVDRAYDAPIGAMSFNWNSINIFVRPTSPGKPPEVRLDPISYGLTLNNRAKTVPNGGNRLTVSRFHKRIDVTGTIGLTTPEAVFYKNIDHPEIWSGENLKFFLSQRDITVKGKVRRGKKPRSARLMAKAESKPISQHVADMMKFSNNYVAEMLAKSLALEAGHVPATLNQGMKLIRDEITEMGVPSSRFHLINPSGLSRRNKIKPIDLNKILAHAYHNFTVAPELLASFPLAGIDGTLKHRLKNSHARGWVRGKTGLLNRVVGLAGYAGNKDGLIRSFVFLFNGNTDRDTVRRLFDDLAAELVTP